MRIALLTNYPLADNKRWKQELMQELARQHEVFAVFGRRSVWRHLDTYLRRRNEIDVGRRYQVRRSPDSENTPRFLRRLGIACYEVSDLNHRASVDLLKRLKPDYGIAAVDHLLRPALIACFPTLLNAHYGNLPQIKGWNATEWSILLHDRLNVCLHEIVERMDAGRIYLKEAIVVNEGDDFEILRCKCQDAAKRLYLRFFAAPDECKKLAETNEHGANYYVMHWQLKALAQKKIDLIARRGG
jgi:methionyl-tRNA formyltransferase